jgi:nucleoside-diphosphate-sugar epimerase
LRALVTGGTGFIGSHLVEALLKRGDRVRCLIREGSDLAWLKGLDVDFFRGDYRDPPSLREAIGNAEVVYHLAGVTRASLESTYFEVNAGATDALLHACIDARSSVRRFVFLSSQAAAGPCRNGRPKAESDPCEPVSLYGQSKRMAEELVLAHAREIPIVILRPTAVYGPRDRDIHAMFRFLARRIKPCLTGGEQRLNLCYVDDLVQAILLSAETPGVEGEIFFVSDGRIYCMEAIQNGFAEALGRKPFKVCIPRWAIHGVAFFAEFLASFSGKPALVNRGKAMEMVQQDWLCDMTKARTLLGFAPRTDLAHGARLTVAWYRENKWL